MVREIDFSKPVSAKDEEYLRTRYSEQYVNHMVGRAAGSEFQGEPDQGEPEHDRNGEMQVGDDPSDFNVGPVVDLMSQPDTTDEERERILEAEKAGEARQGILG